MPFSSETIVVIPTMNRATLVVNALDAILKQTLQPDCLVVVDDGSTDNSLEVIRDWKARTNPPFETKLIALPYNMGVAVARNIGFAQARSNHRCVYFLDSDDIPPPHFLQHTTAALNQRPDAAAITADRFFYNKNKKKAFFSSYASIGTVNSRPWPPILYVDGIGPASLFRSDSIRQLGGYNETRPFGEDGELFFRLVHSGHWLYISTCPVTIRHLDASIVNPYTDIPRAHTHMFENWIKIFSKQELAFLPFHNKFLARGWTGTASVLFFSKQELAFLPFHNKFLARGWTGTASVLFFSNKHNLQEATDCYWYAVVQSAINEKDSLSTFMLYFSRLMFCLCFGWFIKKLHLTPILRHKIDTVRRNRIPIPFRKQKYTT